MGRTFDLLEFQREARESSSLSRLYDLFDECSTKFQKREITEYQYDEMRQLIFACMNTLGNLKRSMES
jgi:hypothetical protein